MASNMGESLENFRHKWEKSYLVHEGKCKHHDLRYLEGWIHLAMVPYSPALGRFSPDGNILAQDIVTVLENKGECRFGIDIPQVTLGNLENPLEKITVNGIYRDIRLIIADHTARNLMLDRKAFTIDGLIDNLAVQWYLKR